MKERRPYGLEQLIEDLGESRLPQFTPVPHTPEATRCKRARWEAQQLRMAGFRVDRVRDREAKVSTAQVRRPARRESHARRPGHRRVVGARAGPDDGPADPEPPRRWRFVVDEHYLVVAVVA